MMEQNEIPTAVVTKPKKSKRNWVILGLCVLLISFFGIQFQEKEEYNQNVLLFQAYMQFTNPNYGRAVSFTIEHGFLSMKYGAISEFDYVLARQSVFFDKISFKETSPRQTFDFLGGLSLHSYDSSIIETLKNNSDVTLDISFKETYTLDEIRALGLKYKCFIYWVAVPGERLELFGFPGTNEVIIRELMANALSYQDHLAGHQKFKDSVRYAFVNGIFVYGIRVTGSSQSLLNLLNDRPVQSVEVIILNGQPVVK